MVELELMMDRKLIFDSAFIKEGTRTFTSPKGFA